ncbi:MAG: hypothetical protein QW808_00740 [Desulfurococcaceae archaeon]
MKIFANVFVHDKLNFKELGKVDSIIFLNEHGLPFNLPDPYQQFPLFLFPSVKITHPMPTRDDICVTNMKGISGLYVLALSGFGLYCKCYLADDRMINLEALNFKPALQQIIVPMSYMLIDALTVLIDSTEELPLTSSPEIVEAFNELNLKWAKFAQMLSDLSAKEIQL